MKNDPEEKAGEQVEKNRDGTAESWQ